MASGAMDKLDQLDKVEKEIVSCLYTAGQALAEIAKVISFFKMINNFSRDEKTIFLIYKLTCGFAPSKLMITETVSF